jgi:hypothetical protein
MTAVALAGGTDPWIAAKIAGAPFLGDRVLKPGWDAWAVSVGVMSHIGVSATWGALFGLLAAGLPAPATIPAGVVWGMIVWIVMYSLLLPILGLAHITSDTPGAVAAGQHLVFGLAVALTFVRLHGHAGSWSTPALEAETSDPHHTPA